MVNSPWELTVGSSSKEKPMVVKALTVVAGLYPRPLVTRPPNCGIKQQ
jgi:hypothetical protein